MYHIFAILATPLAGDGKPNIYLKKMENVRFIGHILGYTGAIQIKEVPHMNPSRTYHRSNVTPKPYPNAADQSYFIQKWTDRLLSVASGVGVAMILAFLLTWF